MGREEDIACDLEVFGVDERGEHLETIADWQTAITGRTELDDGYRFELERRDGLIETIGRFIENERKCCPFFDFDLRVPTDGSLALTITGPEGAKAILSGRS